MLTLRDIRKNYTTGGISVEALKGISLSFRKNEFVAVLGPSGCGKTTLLNIIGGLDHYTSGELTIAGKSTVQFKERDWDSYRNHSVGFVFQNYNLIPHQTVLSNVELALTLSGVSKGERRRRAKEVLEKVGLGDQIHKKPNQMSGGQMQRVAIARALVNDPEIVLADEPTGALDSETSLQIMQLLKEVAKDRLVIMVTHNPELAQQYATRTIRLLDGKIVSDSEPYEQEEAEERAPQVRKPSMSFRTALSLSFNNLLTKKARTILIAIAGSIGIIGIALILSLSTGVKNYINGIEADALSSYPITIERMTTDSESLLVSMMGIRDDLTREPEEGIVTTNTVMSQMYNAMLSSSSRENDLNSFMNYVNGDKEFQSLVTAVQCSYPDIMRIYNTGDAANPVCVYPNTLMGSMTGMTGLSYSSSALVSSTSSEMAEFWHELPGDKALWKTQYNLLTGRWPNSSDEVLLVVDQYQRINDLALYAQGLKDQSTLMAQFTNVMSGTGLAQAENMRFTYEELMQLQFTAMPASALYVFDSEDGLYHNAEKEPVYWEQAAEQCVALHICGIVQVSTDSVSTTTSGSILYTNGLTNEILSRNGVNAAARAQLADHDHDVRTGLLFTNASDAAFLEAFDPAALNDAQASVLSTLSGDLYTATARKYASSLFSSSTYERALDELGYSETVTPSSINIYPKNFGAKDRVIELIEAYNDRAVEQGTEGLNYTDYVGLLMSSISTIISAITWVLVAFVAISLVVSSIMIGVITYISVLERTKEIGILRSIGASRKDIMRVFNAETFVIGLFAGLLGIGIAWLFTFPANAIVYNLAEIENIAILPLQGAVVLVAISVLLTLIAGLIPSRFASNRDPVIALRSE